MEDFRGRRDTDHLCAHHEDREGRFERLEEEVKKLPRMNSKISVGIGVVISAVCIASVLFGTVNNFKIEVASAQDKHELIVRDQQELFKVELEDLKDTVGKISIETATISAELRFLREELHEDREELLIYLREVMKNGSP